MIVEQGDIMPDIETIIKTAKLGRERKAAQEDACAVFAAALFDVLTARGVPCKLITVEQRGCRAWAHSVVEAEGRYYDSMGEFSTGIYRARAKVHPSVKLDISYKADFREHCYDEDFDELHNFYVNRLNKAWCSHPVSPFV